MSIEYDRYLKEHIKNVGRAYTWIMGLIRGSESLRQYFPEPFDIQDQINKHDYSKYDSVEYLYYDHYFYPRQYFGTNSASGRSADVTNQFKRAFLTHIHKNPHHWQYWVLIHDDPGEDFEPLEMPTGYLLEMVCDWMSFGINMGDPGHISEFYLEHKDHILLNRKTRKLLELILNTIENAAYDKNEKGEYTCEFWKVE